MGGDFNLDSGHKDLLGSVEDQCSHSKAYLLPKKTDMKSFQLERELSPPPPGDTPIHQSFASE